MLAKTNGEVMTLEQAFQKAYKTQPNNYECQRVLDMGDVWAFYFSPPAKDFNDTIIGLCHITINKKTGALGTFQPVQNLKLFAKAKPIEIK